MGDEVDVHVNGKVDVLDVFLGQGGEVDMYAWNVDALVRTEVALVLHLGNNCRPVDVKNFHGEGTVVE